MESVSDDLVLAIGARENRILVTHDLKTMPGHFAPFLSHSPSPGVLLSQKTSVAEAIDALLLAWLASEAEEWVNRICRLPL